MPRFSIKDLLVATTLVSVGAGLICFGIQLVKAENDPRKSWELIACELLVCWWGGGALIGAGLFTPFKRPGTGVVVGLAIQFLIMILAPALQQAS